MVHSPTDAQYRRDIGGSYGYGQGRSLTFGISFLSNPCVVGSFGRHIISATILVLVDLTCHNVEYEGFVTSKCRYFVTKLFRRTPLKELRHAG